MTRFDTVKALVFYVFGTVVDWREGIARDAAPVLAGLGRRDIDPRAFADAWRKRYQPAMEECRSGRRAWTRLDVLHRENLELVLKDHGLDPARIGEAELAEWNHAWRRLDPWPEAVASPALRAAARSLLWAATSATCAGASPRISAVRRYASGCGL